MCALHILKVCSLTSKASRLKVILCASEHISYDIASEALNNFKKIIYA